MTNYLCSLRISRFGASTVSPLPGQQPLARNAPRFLSAHRAGTVNWRLKNAVIARPVRLSGVAMTAFLGCMCVNNNLPFLPGAPINIGVHSLPGAACLAMGRRWMPRIGRFGVCKGNSSKIPSGIRRGFSHPKGNYISLIAAWAAARRAMGTRKGLQDT